MSSFVIILLSSACTQTVLIEDDIIWCNTACVLRYVPFVHCIYCQLLVPAKSICHSLCTKLEKNTKNLNHVSQAHSILPSHSTRYIALYVLQLTEDVF